MYPSRVNIIMRKGLDVIDAQSSDAKVAVSLFSLVGEKADHLDSSCSEGEAWQAIEQGGEPSANITLLHGTPWLVTVCYGTPLVKSMISDNMMCESAFAMMCAGKRGIDIKGLIYEPWPRC